MTINSSSTGSSSVSACDSYTWEGNTYTTSGAYTHTYLNEAGCDSVHTLNLTITPSTTHTTTIAACGNYTWSVNGQTYSQSGNYYVVNGCHTETLDLVIYNNSTTTITASGPLALCAGGNVTLSADNAASYLWSNGATTQSIVVSAAGTYSVTATSNGGCVASSNAVTVVNKSMPTAMKIKAVGLTTVCDPLTVAFVIDLPLGATTGFNYQWASGGSPIIGATDSTYTAIGASSGSISLTVSGSNCLKTSAGKAYTIKPLPTANFTAGGPTTFCQGQSVTLTAPTILGYTYTWLNNGVSAGAGVTKIFKVAGSITMIAKLAGCADTTINPITIVVNPLPIAIVAADPSTPTTFCAGQICNLWASPTSAANYHWVSGLNLIDLPTYINNVTTAGAWKVIVTDNNGCVSKTSAGITTKVNAIPVAGITITGTAAQIAFATNSFIKLNATPSTGVTWQWYLNGNPISGATTKSYNATTAGAYTVACTKLGCTGISTAVNLTKASAKEEVGTTNNTGETVFEMTAYPNPVNDVLTVKVSGIENVDGMIQVMDINGKLIISKALRQAQGDINMSGEATGTYFIRYKDNEGRTGTLKVVKE